MSDAPLVIFLALLHLLHDIDGFSVWRPQKWAQYCGWCTTSAKWRERITSVDLLAVLFLKQPTILLATFAARTRFSGSCSTCLPGPAVHFLPSCVTAHHPPVGTVRGQDAAFSFLELHKTSGNPFFWVIEVPLNGSTFIRSVSHSSQLCVLIKLSSHLAVRGYEVAQT